MFDARKMLDAIVAGNAQPAAPSQTDLSSILNQVLAQAQSGGAPAQAPAQGQAPAAAPTDQAGGLGGLGGLAGSLGGLGGLGGMLGQVLGGQGGQAGGLGDVLSKLQAGGSGALGDILKQVQSGGAVDAARNIFGNATQGVQDAARKVNQQTGAGAQLDDIVRQLSGGQGAGDLVAKARELIKNNPGLAGALAGALGTMVVGTGAGRSIATSAAKLGGLVLIGGLAYKAYENYRAGQSATASASAPAAPAPSGSGFEAQAQSQDNAALYIRAMIAAASADGVVDDAERARIIGGMEQAGHGGEAAQFLANEMARPATAQQLAAAASSPEVAVQTYTAARVAIEPDSDAEKQFLAALASALKLDPGLAAHIDAAASGAKV